MAPVGGPERTYQYEAYRIRVKVWPAFGGWTAEWFVAPDPQAPPGESPGYWLREGHKTQDEAYEAGYVAARKWLDSHT